MLNQISVFDEIIITLTDQNKRLLESENEVNLNYLLINRDGMLFCRTKNEETCQRICIFVRTLSKNYEKQLLDATAKAGLDALKITSKN